jgi:hypothetical protein
MATAKQPAAEPRHTPYPYYSIQKSLELTEAVRDLGGVNSDVSKALIARHLKMDESSPSLIGVIGAAKMYGLLDGRGNYRLTEIAKRYFSPTNETDKQVALLEMVKGPPLFAALIDKFDGTRLPTQEILVNILERDHRIAESWRTRAASLFLSSIREANVIDGAGFVRYKASLHGANNATLGGMRDTHSAPPERPVETVLPTSPLTAPVRYESGPDADVWQFKIGDQTVRVETSRELTIAAWTKLNQYVQILKPAAEGSA